MMLLPPVRPHIYCCPVGATVNDQDGLLGMDEEEVDPKMALMGEPIIGMERVVYDDATGPGALAARPLPSPSRSWFPSPLSLAKG